MVDNNENEGGEGAANAPGKVEGATEVSTGNEGVQAAAEEVSG